METNKQTSIHNQKMKGGLNNMNKIYTMLLIAFLVVGTSGLTLTSAEEVTSNAQVSQIGFFKSTWAKFKLAIGFKETKQANLANKIAQLKDVGASEQAIQAAQINYNKLSGKVTAVKTIGASPTNPSEKPLFTEESSFNSEFWRSIYNRIDNADLTDRQKAQLWKRFWNALYGQGSDNEDSAESGNSNDAYWRSIVERFKNASPNMSDEQRSEIAKRLRNALYSNGYFGDDLEVSYESLETELDDLEANGGSNGINIARWRSIYNRIVNSNFSDEKIARLLHRFYNALEDHGYNFDFDSESLEDELADLESDNGSNGINIARWRSIYNRIVNSNLSDERIARLLNRFYNALEGHGYHFDFDDSTEPIKLTPSKIVKVANQNVFAIHDQ
ncbi:hypothetical protein HN876_02815 [archaeon]|jgi:hypothetical protein|nr:hypothetical protein [archaeon]MBT6182744.1 hypothetical protein [archaeon]MBT6606551.1 hypothetical protein [archaeon]MBT7251822.1 hypothetical protein [archaeon]